MTQEPTMLGTGFAARMAEIQKARAENPDGPPHMAAGMTDAEWLAKLRSDRLQRAYERTVPPAWREAVYADLTAQEQCAGAVAPWLASGSPTLLLVGASGIGKTHAAYAVLNDAHQQGLEVAGGTTVDLLASMRPNPEDPQLAKDARKTQLFLLDDLGVEKPTETALSELTNLLSTRGSSNLRQIITTNLGQTALEDHLGHRTVDRLLAGATIAKFTGASRRQPW